ncbi:MAG: hypothetical protein CMD20_02060 [Flavobacteriales bacterium]|nr:hypothetical protein [Flavobacteriales bacterium]
MRRILIITIVLLSNFGFSQKVNGIIQSNTEPIKYANILLYQSKDSSFVEATLSDTLGVFSIELPSLSESYYLSIQIIGYENFTSETFRGNKSFGIINIKLDKNQRLDEVNINVSKPLFEKTGRGMIVNIGTSPIISSGSTQDALEKIPGVTVNIDGGLTLKGNENVRIYIDGKPTYMDLKDLKNLLENTPANEIEKIEVFETPPSKFEAAGNAGIINIIRKKSKGLGYKGYMGGNIGYGNFHKLSPWIYSNYRTKKTNVYGSAWYYNNKSDQYTTEDILMNINNEFSTFYNSGHRVSNVLGSGSRVGVDYFLDKKNTVGYLGVIYEGKSIGDEPSSISVTGPAKDNYDFIEAVQKFDYGWFGQTHNLNFKRDIGKGEYLNIDLDFIKRGNYNKTSTLNEYFIQDSALTPNFFKQDGFTNNLIGVSKIDYAKTIFKNWSFETGAKASWVRTKNDFKAYIGESIEDATEDLNQSNQFHYEEAIYSGYVVMAKKWSDKLNLDAGIRIERTNTKGISQNIDSTYKNNYTNIFPNVSLKYQITKNHNLSLALTSRIKRPAYWQLNPFTSQVNQFIYSTGNPLLQPQITDKINLSWGIKNSIFFSLSASQTLGIMTNVIEQIDSLERQIHSIQNLDDFYNFNFNSSVPIKIKKWWLVNLSGTLYNNQLVSKVDFGTLGYKLSSFNFKMQQFITFPKKWKFEISGFYNHDSYWNIYFVEPYYQIDIGGSKKFKNLNISFSLKDFLNIRKSYGGVFQNNIKMPNTYKPESRILQVNIVYTLGKKEVKSERKRKTGSEDILERVKE